MDDDHDKNHGHPLSNADFRKLFETPRRASDDGRGHRKHSDGQRAAHKKKPPRPKPEEVVEKKEDVSGYRDRAEERRKGVNPDYEHVAASLPGQGEAGLAALSVTDSKFLGGDVEHTHLVKGLDYALLQKVKGELSKHEEEDQQDGGKKAVKKEEVLKFQTPLGRALYNAMFNPAKVDISELFLPRRTAFVYDLDEHFSTTDIPTTLRRSKADCPPVGEMVMGMVDSNLLERISKIMSYMRLSAGGKGGRRLKKKDKLSILGIDPDGKPRKIPPPPMFDAHAKGPAVEDDEDLFGDSTAAAPGDQRGAAVPSGLQAKTGGSYFGNQRDDMADLAPLRPTAGSAASTEDVDMELEEGEAPPPPPPPPGGMVGPARPPAGVDVFAYPSAEDFVQASVALQASQDPEFQALLARQKEMRGELPNGAGDAVGEPSTRDQKEAGRAASSKQANGSSSRERDPGYVSDAYAECYPGYHTFAATVVDSDEEDYTHMDTRDKGRSRLDFDTEEQWQTYKSNKEMMPKAAYQFGVKMGMGARRARAWQPL
eukprot:jgi/Botrbrau1/16123/Bobra.7_2s0083.2